MLPWLIIFLFLDIDICCVQLGQLDVAIKEHKQELERKVESLQQSLEARERELRDAQRELTDRNMKVRAQSKCVTGFALRDIFQLDRH